MILYSLKQGSEMDFDGFLNDHDHDHDGDEVDSYYDEDFLLEDNEDEMHQFHPSMDFGEVPLAQDNAEEEEEDDEISLHPDDSLFDEEDDLGVNNDGMRQRCSVHNLSCINFDGMPGLHECVQNQTVHLQCFCLIKWFMYVCSRTMLKYFNNGQKKEKEETVMFGSRNNSLQSC